MRYLILRRVNNFSIPHSIIKKFYFFGSEKFWIYLFIFLKLILVSRNEIVALPNDSAVFVKFALSSIEDLGPPVGYPLWLLAIKSIGFPQRVAIEICYLTACCILYQQVRYFLHKPFSLLLMLLLIFNPVSFHLFDNALSDSLYVCLVLGCIALSIGLIRNVENAGIGCYLLIGLFFGVMGIVRNEAELMFVWLVWLALFLASKMRMLHLSSSRWITVGVRFISAVGLASLLNTLPAAFHLVNQGVWVKTVPALPSHMKMLANLAAIEDAEEKIPRISISKAARLKAYEVSPSLSILKDYIEDDANMYMVASRVAGGLPPGEIGNGWVWHVFNDAAINKLPNPRTIKALDDFWKKVNSELSNAFVLGKLNHHLVVHPFISGDILSVIKGLPQGLAIAYEKIFNFMPYQIDQHFSDDQFDELALRRSALVGSSIRDMDLRGWIVALEPSVKIKNVQVGVQLPGNAHTVWVDAVLNPREDVSASVSSQLGKNVEAVGFEVKSVRTSEKFFKVRYFTNLDVIVDEDNAIDAVRKINSVGSGDFLKAVDRLSLSQGQPRQDLMLKIQAGILDWTGWLFVRWVGIVIIFGAVFKIGYLVLSRKNNILPQEFILLVFVMGVAMQRLTFYGILDHFAWEIESRYVAPVFALWIVSVILATTSLIFIFRNRRSEL